MKRLISFATESFAAVLFHFVCDFILNYRVVDVLLFAFFMPKSLRQFWRPTLVSSGKEMAMKPT